MQDRWRSFTAMTVVAVASAGAFWLLRERGHMLGLAPYLLFLSCPLTHLFMHRGHGRGAGPTDRAQDRGEAPGAGSVRRGAPSAWR